MMKLKMDLSANNLILEIMKQKFSPKEWDKSDFEKVEHAIKDHFGGKTFINHRNEQITFPLDSEGIENVLGLPYTSTSAFPMMAFDCNVNIFDPINTDYHYDFVALDTEGKVIFALSNENEDYIFRNF